MTAFVSEQSRNKLWSFEAKTTQNCHSRFYHFNKLFNSIKVTQILMTELDSQQRDSPDKLWIYYFSDTDFSIRWNDLTNYKLNDINSTTIRSTRHPDSKTGNVNKNAKEVNEAATVKPSWQTDVAADPAATVIVGNTASQYAVTPRQRWINTNSHQIEDVFWYWTVHSHCSLSQLQPEHSSERYNVGQCTYLLCHTSPPPKKTVTMLLCAVKY